MNDFVPLTNIEIDISFDVIKKHVEHSVSLDLKQVTECNAWRADKHIAIVGGGPSLKDHLDDLRKYKNIMACGSVHDYLIDNGIYPNWCVLCDPDIVVIDYLKNKNLVTEYLVASQCHSKVFEHLKGLKTYIWHAGGDEKENAIAGFPTTDYIVGGGCTVGTRAIIMSTCFGFYDIDLFGMDSCIKDDQHHAYEFKNETETLGDVYEIKLDGEESPTFKVAGYMIAQIKDFQTICNIYSKEIRFKVYGDSLLAYLVNLAEQRASQIKEV